MLKKPNVLEKRDSRLKNYKYQCRLAAGVTLMLALAASVSQRRPSTHDLKKNPNHFPNRHLFDVLLACSVGNRRCAFSRNFLALSGWLLLTAFRAILMHRSASSLFESIATQRKCLLALGRRGMSQAYLSGK